MFWNKVEELRQFLLKDKFSFWDCRPRLRSPKVQSTQPIIVGKHRMDSNLVRTLRAKVVSGQAVYGFLYIPDLSLLMLIE